MMDSSSKEIALYLMGEHAAVLQSLGVATLACQRRIWNVAQQLRQAGGYIDVVPGMNNLTAIVDPQKRSAEHALSMLETFWYAAGAQEFTSRVVTIPVHYGGQSGPDLEFVAAHAGLTPERVIEAHSGAQYVVYFLGFQPGFAYLGGLPECLATPRRAEPRLAVPAGSVGIGGAQTGIYPAASPGGWQLIGRTDVCLFDAASATPTLLQPGDVIQFVAQPESRHD
jgi:KipI family sensor histidine kinase inhibitor